MDQNSNLRIFDLHGSIDQYVTKWGRNRWNLEIDEILESGLKGFLTVYLGGDEIVFERERNKSFLCI